MTNWQMIWEELIFPVSYKAISVQSFRFSQWCLSKMPSYFDMRFSIFFIIISGLPVFTKVPQPHAAPVQHTTFQVSCQAEGFPRPTVTWSRVGMPLPAGRVEVNQGTLTIKNLTDADSGLYDCVATNIMGTKKTRTNVAVQRHLGLYIYKLEALFTPTYISSKI